MLSCVHEPIYECNCVIKKGESKKETNRNAQASFL